MAAIVTLPQAPNTGLGTLGQVLLGSASEYAQNRRTDDREARLRAQRLADVEDDRRYADTREASLYQRNRNDRLADVAEGRTYQEGLSEREARLAFAREMARMGYLAPGKIKDEAAIDAAAERFARDGLAQRYLAAIQSGDLAYADLGDAAKVEAGLAKFSERMGKRTAFQEGLPAEATLLVQQKEQELRVVADKAQALERVLGQPEPQPNPQQVAQVALRLAQATKKPGEMPSQAEISAMAGQAQEEVAMQLALRWNQQRQDALVQRSLLQDQARNLSAEINTLRNRFGVVGAPKEQPAAAGNAERLTLNAERRSDGARTGAPDLGAAQRNFAETIAAELAKRRPVKDGTNGTGGMDVTNRLNEPSYPAFSILGAAERVGNAIPKVGAAIPRGVSRLMEVPVRIDKAAGALGTGILTGDYSVPAVGGLGRIGEALGESAAAANAQAEEDILRNAPYSARAYEIRRQRGLPQPSPLMQ